MTEPSRVLLRRADIAALAGTAKQHFLNPNARRINKSLGDATGLTGLGIHLIEVPPGAESTELHRHYLADEAVYVVSGQARLVMDDQTHQVAAGDFMGFPAGGVAHALENPGPEPLVCLVIGQRLDNDVADYPRLNKRLYIRGSQWDLVDHEHIVDPKAQHPDAGKK